MNSLEISPIRISKQDQKFLEKSGFMVVECISFLHFIKRFTILGGLLWIFFFPYLIICLIVSIIISIFVGTFGQTMNILLYGWFSIYTIVLICLIIWYIRWKYLFLTSEGAIAFFRWYPTWETSYLKWYDLYNLDLYKYKKALKMNSPRIYEFIKWLAFVASAMLFGTLMLIVWSSDENIIGLFLYAIIAFLIFQIIISICLLWLDWIIAYLYPIISFGKIWKKIQRITPQISEQSQIIQAEFEKNMDFSKLHTGFAWLSSLFSHVLELVIEIEKIETRANKGNMFDSKKYINSLRMDIMEPLQSLKGFLEIQKKKLFDSQQELISVWERRDQLSEYTVLQSKRTELVIGELDSNIILLQDMIQKMS